MKWVLTLLLGVLCNAQIVPTSDKKMYGDKLIELKEQPVINPELSTDPNGQSLMDTDDEQFTNPNYEQFTGPKYEPLTDPKDKPFMDSRDEQFTDQKYEQFTEPKYDKFMYPKDEPFMNSEDDQIMDLEEELEKLTVDFYCLKDDIENYKQEKTILEDKSSQLLTKLAHKYPKLVCQLFPGLSYTAADGCNKCACGSRDMPVCTLMFCGPFPRPGPEPRPAPRPRPRPMPRPRPRPRPTFEPKPTPGPRPIPVPRPRPRPEPRPRPRPRPRPKPGPKSGPRPRPRPRPKPRPTPVPRKTPGPKPRPSPGPRQSPGPGPKPTPGPRPTSTPRPRPVTVCKQPIVVGRCKARLRRWFFNIKTEKCETFFYGGCGGNDNNFNTEDECNNKCGKKETENNLGSEEYEGEDDEEDHDKVEDEEWTDSKQGHGDNEEDWGTDNDSWEDEEEYEEDEFAEESDLEDHEESVEDWERWDEEDVCSQPKEVGPCKMAKQRWFYHWESGKCKKFTYGGCKGNGNNFETKRKCRDMCCFGQEESEEGGEESEEEGENDKVCPPPKKGTFGICVERCSVTVNDCPGGKLCCPAGLMCCSNGCGHTCVAGVPVSSVPCKGAKPLKDKTGEDWYCGKGGERCPEGYYCDIEKADRWATCCKKDTPKRG